MTSGPNSISERSSSPSPQSEPPIDPAAADRYCRKVLPSVSRTFALSVRVLPGTLGTAVLTAYLVVTALATVRPRWAGDRPLTVASMLVAKSGGDDIPELSRDEAPWDGAG